MNPPARNPWPLCIFSFACAPLLLRVCLLSPVSAQTSVKSLTEQTVMPGIGSAGVSAQTSAKPLTLQRSVELALQSPQAHAARFARDAARVEADRDKPVARPTVNATASGTLQEPRLTFPRPNGTEAPFLREQTGRVDLVVEQLLYRAGLGAARQRYAAQSALAVLEYHRTLSDLALSARKAYIETLRAEAGVAAAQDGLTAARRYQQQVQHQIDAGLAKPVDARTVEAQVAEAQSGVRQAEGGLALARMNFNRALGRPLETPVLLEPLPDPPAVPESPAVAVANALQNRTELRVLGQNLRSARAGVSLARTQSQPALSVRGQVTEQTPTALVPQNYVAATLELRWSLLDGGKRRSDLQEARAQEQRLESVLEDTRQALALEVTGAWQKMREARDRIMLAQIQRRGTEATALVAEKSYEVGRSTVLEVQSAQREVRVAQEHELQALYDLYAAAADFAHAQGLDMDEVLGLAEGRTHE